MKRAVFLDRDGVINRAIVRWGKPYPPSTLLELEILPGVYEALKRLHDENYLLIVVTNQPDVARGKLLKQDVELIHNYLLNKLPIDQFKTCYHDNYHNCSCRKPMPGALLEAAKEHGIEMSKSYMIGDRWRDVEAGALAGCKTLFINYGYAEKNPLNPDYIVSSLLEAGKIILGK